MVRELLEPALGIFIAKDHEISGTNQHQFICPWEDYIMSQSRFIILLLGHGFHRLWYEILILFPITSPGLPIFLEEWALWYGVEIEFLPQNFLIGFPSNWDHVHIFFNLHIGSGDIVFELRHLNGFQLRLDFWASCACVREKLFYNDKNIVVPSPWLLKMYAVLMAHKFVW